MTLQTLLEHRRSVRHYADTPIDPETVRRCLKTAQLAPSSSNMQLYEFYHITDPAVIKRLAEACFNQQAAATAQQMVVFVTRQDLFAKRARAVLEFEAATSAATARPKNTPNALPRARATTAN